MSHRIIEITPLWEGNTELFYSITDGIINEGLADHGLQCGGAPGRRPPEPSVYTGATLFRTAPVPPRPLPVKVYSVPGRVGALDRCANFLRLTWTP